MKLLYDLFFLTFGLMYLPYLFAKGKMHRGFSQKFGFIPSEVKNLKKPVWIHAVSVGEAVLAAKLAAKIKERFGNIPIAVSTTTQTGRDMIKSSGKGNVDAVFYYPMDLSFVVSRAVGAIDPRVYIMIETELWPNLLRELHSKNIPVILANGRISDSSFTRYARIKFVMWRVLRCIDRFCMQSEKDAEKIEQLGALPQRIFVTGNMKFDGQEESCENRFAKESLGFERDDDIVVAGSTHEPECTIMLDIYKKLRKDHQGGLKLILAPRHVERVDALKGYIKKSGLDYRQFSHVLKDEASFHRRCDVLLVDTIGHLRELYSVATAVFIGGSLTARGGQNPIEAARWGKPVIFGPRMSNFRAISEIFLENEAAVRVKDAGGLEKALKSLLQNPSQQERMAENAKRVIKNHAGAVAKTVEGLKEYMGDE